MSKAIEQAAGWAVAVRTTQIYDGVPTLVLFAASFPDKASAIELVRQRFASTSNEEVGDAYPLSAVTIKAMGMDVGECDML